MQAKEYGMGYRVEWENTIHCVPTPLVLIDSANRFHSETDPAIRWKGGKEFYYLHGVSFHKKHWEEVLSKSMSFKNVLAIDNMEQRMIALKYIGAEKLLESANALHIKTSKKGNELYVIPKEQNIFPQEEFFIKYSCPSTGRVYVKCIDPEIGKKHDPDLALASTFMVPVFENGKLDYRPQTKEEYLAMTVES